MYQYTLYTHSIYTNVQSMQRHNIYTYIYTHKHIQYIQIQHIQTYTLYKHDIYEHTLYTNVCNCQ